MWEIQLTDDELHMLRSLVRAERFLGPGLSDALDALEQARWTDLPEPILDWERVGDLADVLGITEAEAFADLASRQAPETDGPNQE